MVRPDRCGRCGGTLRLAKDTSTRTLVDWVAGYVQRRVVALNRCRCADGGKVTAPVAPGACLPKTQVTAAFGAHLLHGTYTLHLALERIRAELARQGYPRASATIRDVVRRAPGERHGVARRRLDHVGRLQRPRPPEVPRGGRPLTAFLRDPNLPVENPFAARDLRAQALGRTNGRFAVGHDSAEYTAVACALVQTARLHGLDVLAYLPWALERVAAGAHRPDACASRTPMAYQEAQQGGGDR